MIWGQVSWLTSVAKESCLLKTVNVAVTWPWEIWSFYYVFRCQNHRQRINAPNGAEERGNG